MTETSPTVAPGKDTEPLPVKAYRRIRDAMSRGSLAPGTGISEPRLSQELSISRTALREALVRLETEGYVERTATGRWQVSQLTRDGAEEMYSCRAALEALAATLAAERCTPADHTVLADLLERARGAWEDGDIDSTGEYCTRFHDTLVQFARSQRLSLLMSMLRPQLLQNRLLMLRHHSRKADFLAQNEALYRAVTERRSDLAAEIARQSAHDDLQAVLHLFDTGVLTERPGLL